MADNMADKNTKCDLDILCRSVTAARKELAKLRKDVKEIKDMFVGRFNEIEMMLKDAGTDHHEINTFEEENLGSVDDTPLSSRLENRSYSKEGSGKPHLITVGQPTSLDRKISLTDEICCSNVIGHIKTCFREKNGIPRQGSVCPLSKAELDIDGVKEFTNPSHALQGLEKFSHVWLIFLFHKNANNSIKAKVRPPRLNGKKIGVFASRSPHRPSAIGLTLAHLDAIHGSKLFLSGIDILDGTPILDIKPYIPEYDSVLSPCTTHCREGFEEYMYGEDEKQTNVLQEGEITKDLTVDIARQDIARQDIARQDIAHSLTSKRISISDWIRQPPISPLSVSYSDKARGNLKKFYNKDDRAVGEECYQLELLTNSQDVQDVIEHILQADPRSIHRRNNCPNAIYHFTVDKVNVSCLFSGNTVQVINVDPI